MHLKIQYLVPLILPAIFTHSCKKVEPRPNILFAIADDWSWPHASFQGCKFVNTPNFDRIAQNGVLFTNAYVTSPSSTPSRGSVLTGQWHWRLEENANLWSTLNPKFEVYPDILEKQGYFVGFTGKGWGPGDWESSGRTRNPAGPEFSKIRLNPPYEGISNIDYAGNFEEFLKERPQDQPFCFWYGGIEPHRVFEEGSWKKAGKKLEDAEVPGCFPDVPEVRGDLLDYAVEIEWYDTHLGRMIQKLEEIGELDNTIIVVTGDNGHAFPHCKSNLYDLGTHVPLAVQWIDKMPGNRKIEDFVSLQDLAPTFLEAAKLKPPESMTGRSLLKLLLSKKSGRIDPERDHVLTGKERHTPAQTDMKSGYPMRAIRTHEYLYIRNFEPDRWPSGIDEHPVLSFFDVDGSPTKTFILDHRNDPDISKYFEMSFGKRPAEELYYLRSDSDELVNVASNPEYATIKEQLAVKLMSELKETGDPRAIGGAEKFDEYKYYGPLKFRNWADVLK